MRSPGSVRLFSSAAAVAAAALLNACGDAGSQPPGGMPPPEVTVAVVKPQSFPVTYEYTGQAAGFREVEVRSRVAGILEKRNFEEGARVAKGQSLYTIDPAPFQSALARAEADLASAGADLASAEADLASVEARAAQARRSVERLKPLYAAKAASQKEHDDAVSAEQIAQADVKAAQARVKAAQARVKAAQARVVDGKLNLGYTRVEAPLTGIAGRSERPEGTLVAGPETLLTVVTQVDPIYVYFGIPETERLALDREAQAKRLVLPKDGRFEVSVKLSDGTVYGRAGRLGFSDIRVNPATGTSEARAQLPNPNGVLRPGQFLRVTLSGASRPNAIVVPQRAVLDSPKGKFVYVVNKESRAEIRPVEVGEWRGGGWLIHSGLAEDDRVIVDGVMKLGPGAPVRVADPSKPGQPGAVPQPPQPGGKGPTKAPGKG